MDAGGVAPPSTQRGSGSQHALRRANVRRALETLRIQGAMTQTELARATGLSNATVSNLVRVMTDEGLVEPSQTTSSGRRAVLVRLADQRRPQVALGLDIGRRHLRLVACTPGRAIVADERLELAPGQEPGEVIALSVDFVRRMLAQYDIRMQDVLGLGVGVPSPVDRGTGQTAVNAVMPQWSGYPVRAEFEAALGVDVDIENDANLGALAEFSWGRHGEVTDLIFVKIATGVGAGIVTGGLLYRGRDGRTGEIGHTNIAEYGPVCWCGGRGCLEAFASCRSMLDLLSVSRPDEPTTIENLVRLALAGEPWVVRIIEDAGLAIGRVLGNAVNILNPQLIVLSGPLLPVGDILLEPVRQGISRFTSPLVTGPAHVICSELEGRAEALGGCELVLRGEMAAGWELTG